MIFLILVIMCVLWRVILIVSMFINRCYMCDGIVMVICWMWLVILLISLCWRCIFFILFLFFCWRFFSDLNKCM